MKHNKAYIKFRVFVIALAVAVSGAFLFTPFTFADNADELKSDLKDVNKEIDSTNKALKEGKAKSSALSTEIKNLEKKIYNTESNINSLTKEINTLKVDIQESYDRLGEKEDEVNVQSDELLARLRTMYKNGDIGMLSVLLGSKDISTFLTNMSMIEKVYEADAKLLSELQGQYDDIDAEKTQLVALKNQLLIKQDELEGMKDDLESDKSSVQTKKKSVDEDNKELAAQIDALNEEANALTAKILALQSSDDYIGGTMKWPSAASTYISSPFGNRLHPILKVYKLHTGIDIAASSGTNILAANSGTVITSGWNNSYGYMVMIDHGGGIVTLYAHSSKLLVAKGDVVARGQTIALVGSTGNSTGPHIHFEVRVNGEYKNPLNYVSP